MGSYYAFAPLYDDWSAAMTDDVAFYVELAREADGPVVELAVGNGRGAGRGGDRPFDRRPFDESSGKFVNVTRKPA